MPEVVLCCRCKKAINKEADEYVIIARATGKHPEVLAHASCEQERATSNRSTIFDDLFKNLRRWSGGW